MFNRLEDKRLVEAYESFGANWNQISVIEFHGAKTPESCRDRLFYLRNRKWNPEEIAQLQKLHKFLYPRWIQIAISPRRPVSECIDRFNGASTGVSSSGEIKLDASKRRSLFYSCRENRVATVQEQLRETPHLINAIDSNERTLLHIASRRGFKDLVDTLLNAGANIDAKDNFDNTPMDDAIDSGHLELVALLRSRGARCKTIDKKFPASLQRDLRVNQFSVGDLDAKLLLESVLFPEYILIVCIAGVFDTESAGSMELMDICSQQKPSSDESDGEMHRKSLVRPYPQEKNGSSLEEQ
ncbi:unnamed protein product [Arabis nemorensis]|uniref:Uncharacterized protein n=1 Tax=Arabis nemorensis TaxID=586526 RepID=A0A565ARA6_9BRAS|nr:unnamed protein product [Arabis nemorensis]